MLRELAVIVGGLMLGVAGVGTAAAGELLELEFPAAGGGDARRVVAFSIGGGRLASVVLPGHLARPAARVDGRGELGLLGHDPVSRVAVLDGAGSGVASKRTGDSLTLKAGDRLLVAGGGEARVAGWARRHGGRVLPVSLLRLNYPGRVPAAGTPLLDAAGRVVAICYQAEPGRESVAYGLPVEVVARVLADLDRDRTVVRTWLGLTMREGAGAAVLVRVEPGAPAARAGLLAGDVLLRVGAREVGDYAEAVNAIFYLVSGESTAVRVMRGVEVIDVMVVPQAVASGVGAAGRS